MKKNKIISSVVIFVLSCITFLFRFDKTSFAQLPLPTWQPEPTPPPGRDLGWECPAGTYLLYSDPAVFLRPNDTGSYCLYPAACWPPPGAVYSDWPLGSGNQVYGCRTAYGGPLGDGGCEYKPGTAYCQACWCVPIPQSTPVPTPTPTPATPTPTPATPTSGCTVSLSPTSSTKDIGESTQYTAAVTASNGTVDQVNFSSSNTSIATLSQYVDTGSPYRSTATGVSGGTVTITASVVMGGIVKCSDTSTFTVTVPAGPNCTVSLSPTSSTKDIGESTQYTAAVTASNGTVDQVNFSSSNTSIATLSQYVDTGSPYRSTATGVSGGTVTITASVVMGGIVKCSDTSTFTVTTPPASCTVNLLPSSTSVQQGNTTTFSASITPLYGNVERVDFSSSNTSIATVSPASDTTAVYSTVATGVSTGTTTIRSNVIMGGITTCTDTSTLNVSTTDPWWQVKDGDVVSTGDIVSDVGSGQIFSDDGEGGYPGLPVYSGILDVNGYISSTSWNSKTTSTSSRHFNYDYFYNLVPDDLVFNPTAGSLGIGAAYSDGYEWFKSDGNLTLNSDTNLGNRRVIMYVDGNFNINGNINLNNGQGFFLAIVSGNITVNPAVDGTPALEGLYITNGIFTSGAGSNQLHLRGSVASYGGFTLNRDLSDNNPPAELFEYAPDQILLFPSKLASRRIRWNEIAP